MRIGFVVDGVSEYQALPAIFGSLRDSTGHTLLKPLKADIQPTASAARIAKQCRTALRVLSTRSCDLAVILIDREERDECPGPWATELRRGLQSVAPQDIGVEVVVKNRMFENWLVADLEALRVQRARFDVFRSVERSVRPNKADHVDAVRLLNTCSTDGRYEKVADSRRILERADIGEMGQHSRSFRRFLRVVEHASYSDQSERPAR